MFVYLEGDGSPPLPFSHRVIIVMTRLGHVEMDQVKDVIREVMMIVESIEESDLFKGASQQFLKEIGNAGEAKHFKRGSIIFRTNEKALYIYQLVEGSVDIMMVEKEVIHFTARRPGEIFGWSGLVEPHVYTATAKCKTDTRAVRISREAVEAAMMKYPADGLAILRHLTGIIAQRLRHAYLYIYSKE
ncbi:MAG: transcriptional regulator FixK [Syntrophorhabdus sp. PtaU1.Bin002]|nr:MAG: transcriptional regulator FixK [Syntrophorhabdus sp. PtaU1.Bin002]